MITPPPEVLSELFRLATDVVSLKKISLRRQLRRLVSKNVFLKQYEGAEDRIVDKLAPVFEEQIKSIATGLAELGDTKEVKTLLEKYHAGQPRDDHGRFAAGGVGGMAPDTGGSYGGGSGWVNEIKFESRGEISLDDSSQQVVKEALRKAAEVFGDNAPQVRRVIIDPALVERGNLGQKSKDTIYLHPGMADPEFRAKVQKEWDGMIIGNNTLESTVTHEYGHIVDGAALNNHPRKYNKDITKYIHEEVDHKEDWATNSLHGKRYAVQDNRIVLNQPVCL